jgi:hypothetical protein
VVGSGEAVAPELHPRAVAPLQWRLVRWRQASHLRPWRQSCRPVCDTGLAARMLSSELEMYPMIAVAHEIAMVRTAGSICMARSAPGSGRRSGAAGAPPPCADSARRELRSVNRTGPDAVVSPTCRSRLREHVQQSRADDKLTCDHGHQVPIQT